MPDLHQPRPLTPERHDGPSPLHALSRLYYREGAGDDLESPAAIVARIRAVIAEKNPELAAAHERAMREQQALLAGGQHEAAPKSSRETRVRAYAEARASGMSRAEAAETVGVSKSTACTYETELRRAAGEAAL